MKIQKLDLRKLGFKKNNIGRKESGANPFHYYTLEIGNDYTKFCLISNAIEKGSGDIEIMIFEYDSFIFTETTELTLLINILRNNYDNSNK